MILTDSVDVWRGARTRDADGGIVTVYQPLATGLACRANQLSQRQLVVNDAQVRAEPSRVFYFEADTDVKEGDYLTFGRETHEVQVAASEFGLYHRVLGEIRQGIPGA
jgi:hypothetical protein